MFVKKELGNRDDFKLFISSPNSKTLRVLFVCVADGKPKLVVS